MSNNPKEIAVEWLKYAEGDLKSAQVLGIAENIPFRNVCYLAQQCVEKSLKALLILSNSDIIRTHDLDTLLLRLPDEMQKLFSEYDLSWLSEWSVEARYPGDWPEVTFAEANQAIGIAKDIYELVEEIFK